MLEVPDLEVIFAGIGVPAIHERQVGVYFITHLVQGRYGALLHRLNVEVHIYRGFDVTQVYPQIAVRILEGICVQPDITEYVAGYLVFILQHLLGEVGCVRHFFIQEQASCEQTGILILGVYVLGISEDSLFKLRFLVILHPVGHHVGIEVFLGQFLVGPHHFGQFLPGMGYHVLVAAEHHAKIGLESVVCRIFVDGLSFRPFHHLVEAGANVGVSPCQRFEQLQVVAVYLLHVGIRQCLLLLVLY